jgi:hypothetical protein
VRYAIPILDQPDNREVNQDSNNDTDHYRQPETQRDDRPVKRSSSATVTDFHQDALFHRTDDVNCSPDPQRIRYKSGIAEGGSDYHLVQRRL